MNLKSWLQSASILSHKNSREARRVKKNQDLNGCVVFLSEHEDSATLQALVDQNALEWQKESILKNVKDVMYFIGLNGPVWLIRTHSLQKNHKESLYAQSRDLMGTLVSFFKAHHLEKIQFINHCTNPDFLMGAFVGLELAAYNFKTVENKQPFLDLPKIEVVDLKDQNLKSVLQTAIIQAQAVNLARHAVNLPPNRLNPQTFVTFIQSLSWSSKVQISVWNEARLRKEKMHLHLAVGQGSKTPSQLLILNYRPHNKKQAPFVFVGKGITFDTGGLDIKPSSAMRLMKKDMGGAAALVGLAHWVDAMAYEHPCTFYFALAENAIGANAFRPSDVYVSRSGKTVEIDNTDAEGRLVLADVLDVAVTQKPEPRSVIDVATLTGAIKVALGPDIAGLFCNDHQLSEQLHRAGQISGDLNWPMPLHDKYFAGLSSPFADFKNSSEGFGGAITAALFLKQFVKNYPWAHLDIYAWTDKPQGALTTSGGSGQAVQCLIEYLKMQKT